MDQHNNQQASAFEPPAPASLLPNVMARLERRRLYLSPELSSQERLAALQHPDWEIRAAAVRALGNQGERVPLDALLTVLHDEHRLVRAAAVRALGNQGERVPLDALLLAMRDPAEEVREMVVLVLAELGERAPDPLKSLLQAAQQDARSNVRTAATYALKRYAEQNTRARETVSAPTAQLPAGTHLGTFPRVLARYALIFKRQIGLVHKSIWFCSPLLLLLWSLRYLVPHTWISAGSASQAGLYLALFTTVAAAAGTAFIYGGERDAGLELTLATPTSVRVIMFLRFLLVISYNILLTAGASTVLALVHGGGIWEIIHLWLGPMLLLSSFTLTISLLLGSWLATVVMLLVEASQALVFHLEGSIPTIDLSPSLSWQSQPLMLCVALLLLAFALYLAPRQPRFAAL